MSYIKEEDKNKDFMKNRHNNQLLANQNEEKELKNAKGN